MYVTKCMYLSDLKGLIVEWFLKVCTQQSKGPTSMTIFEKTPVLELCVLLATIGLTAVLYFGNGPVFLSAFVSSFVLLPALVAPFISLIFLGLSNNEKKTFRTAGLMTLVGFILYGLTLLLDEYIAAALLVGAMSMLISTASMTLRHLLHSR